MNTIESNMSVYMLTYIFVHYIKILKLATDDFHFNLSTINIIKDIFTYYKMSSVPFRTHGNSVFFNDSFSQTLYNLFSGSVRVGVQPQFKHFDVL